MTTYKLDAVQRGVLIRALTLYAEHAMELAKYADKPEHVKTWDDEHSDATALIALFRNENTPTR